MEQFFLEIAKISPLVAVLGFMYYKQGQGYKCLVDRVQDENSKREEKYQETIQENQQIILQLTSKINIIEDIKSDVKEVKEFIFKK